MSWQCCRMAQFETQWCMLLQTGLKWTKHVQCGLKFIVAKYCFNIFQHVSTCFSALYDISWYCFDHLWFCKACMQSEERAHENPPRLLCVGGMALTTLIQRMSILTLHPRRGKRSQRSLLKRTLAEERDVARGREAVALTSLKRWQWNQRMQAKPFLWIQNSRRSRSLVSVLVGGMQPYLIVTPLATPVWDCFQFCGICFIMIYHDFSYHNLFLALFDVRSKVVSTRLNKSK